MTNESGRTGYWLLLEPDLTQGGDGTWRADVPELELSVDGQPTEAEARFALRALHSRRMQDPAFAAAFKDVIASNADRFVAVPLDGGEYETIMHQAIEGTLDVESLLSRIDGKTIAIPNDYHPLDLGPWRPDQRA